MKKKTHIYEMEGATWCKVENRTASYTISQTPEKATCENCIKAYFPEMKTKTVKY